MKLLIFPCLAIATSVAAAAPDSQITDPAKGDRLISRIQVFNAAKGAFETPSFEAALLDGNEGTGARIEAGRHQFLIALPSAAPVQRITMLGAGAARFTISTSNQKASPGPAWQSVLKNIPLAASWGTEHAIDRDIRYILLETETTRPFNLTELGAYRLPAVASGHRYLSDWLDSRKQEAAPAPEPAPAKAPKPALARKPARR
jgi:hypothetical protein